MPFLYKNKYINICGCSTFQPEVVFECVCEQLGGLVAHHGVGVDGDAADAGHAVQVGAPVPQRVLPRLIVPLHRLMLQVHSEHHVTVNHFLNYTDIRRELYFSIIANIQIDEKLLLFGSTELSKEQNENIVQPATNIAISSSM